jgi:exosortase/archaeosortase family protein
LAYAYLFRGIFRQRLLVVGLTIPVSLLASTLRLTTIAVLSYYVGAFMAEPRPHVIISWVVFALILMLSVALDRKVASREGEAGSGGDAPKSDKRPQGGWVIVNNMTSAK